jgi:hypothetical protein
MVRTVLHGIRCGLSASTPGPSMASATGWRALTCALHRNCKDVPADVPVGAQVQNLKDDWLPMAMKFHTTFIHCEKRLLGLSKIIFIGQTRYPLLLFAATNSYLQEQIIFTFRSYK